MKRANKQHFSVTHMRKLQMNFGMVAATLYSLVHIYAK